MHCKGSLAVRGFVFTPGQVPPAHVTTLKCMSAMSSCVIMETFSPSSVSLQGMNKLCFPLPLLLLRKVLVCHLNLSSP